MSPGAARGQVQVVADDNVERFLSSRPKVVAPGGLHDDLAQSQSLSVMVMPMYPRPKPVGILRLKAKCWSVVDLNIPRTLALCSRMP